MPPLFVYNPESWQAANLVGWYAGADPSNAATAFDSSVNANHGGTYNFTYPLTPGMPYGGSGGPGNVPGYIMFLENGAFHTGAVAAGVHHPPYTMTMWAYIWFDRGGGAVHMPWVGYFGAMWSMHYVQVAGAAGSEGISENTAISVTFPGGTSALAWSYTGGWRHITVRASAVNYRELFVNAVKATTPDTVNQPTDLVYHSFGAAPGDTTHIVYGYVDDVRIYDRLLSDQEIAEIAHPERRLELYLYPAPPFTPENAGFFC